MKPGAIPRKTEQGREEIATRARGLSARLRQLLIRIDGSMSAGAIAYAHASPEEIFALLEELQMLGLISIGDDAEVVPAAVAPVLELDTERVVLARRWLIEFAQSTLGGAAGDAVERIQRCTTYAELDVLARSCGEVVAAVAGRHKAEQFLAEWRRVFAPS